MFIFVQVVKVDRCLAIWKIYLGEEDGREAGRLYAVAEVAPVKSGYVAQLSYHECCWLTSY